jgi:molecular chaperone GrpE (heat shock protein)
MEDWQEQTRKLAASDVGFAAGLLVAQLLQTVQQLSERVAAIEKEWQNWREQLPSFIQMAQALQEITQLLPQLRVALEKTQEQLAQNFLSRWQEWQGAQQAIEWASRTLSYQQSLKQLIADAEAATEKETFVRTNSTRIESLVFPFSLPPSDQSELDWLRSALEAEGEKARNEALERLEQMGISLRLPKESAPFESAWQQIVDGKQTDDPSKNDTIVEVRVPAIFIGEKLIRPAQVIVWKGPSRLRG